MSDTNIDRAERHRQKAAEALRRKEESWERSDTDGFLTQWACGLTAELEDTRADIEEAGGTAIFTGLYKGDERIYAKQVSFKCRYSHQTKYNWLLEIVEEKRFGRRFIPCGPNSRIQKQLGLIKKALPESK